jgi:hypothetical protein
MIDMGESRLPKPVTETPYFTVTTQWSAMVVMRGRSI